MKIRIIKPDGNFFDLEGVKAVYITSPHLELSTNTAWDLDPEVDAPDYLQRWRISEQTDI